MHEDKANLQRWPDIVGQRKAFEAEEIFHVQIFIYLVTFIPRYLFIFFPSSNYKWIVFLMSISDSLMVVYRNTTNFFYIDFVSCDFTKLVYSNSFYVEVFRIFYNITSYRHSYFLVSKLNAFYSFA